LKTITVPAAIDIKDPLTDVVNETVGFQRFAFLRWLNHEDAAKSLTEVHRWMEVISRFKAAPNPGDKIVLEDEDYKRLSDIVTKVMPTLPVMAAVQLLPFAEAVLKAV
jgi:hypothetical protein